MHLLILGYSDIVRRRVLPAAQSVEAIERISIASRRASSLSSVSSQPPALAGGRWFNDYAEAISSSGADAVYVSGINSEHAAWVTCALERGLDTIVDKPAFLDLATAQRALRLARERGSGLAEATVFTFHPQADAIRRLLPAEERRSTRVTAILSIPPRPPGDFRMRADSGGGSIYDLGPYAAAINRLIFGAPPAHLDCRVLSYGAPDDGPRRPVDTSFSVLMTHDHGGSVAGHFGFVATYQNRFAALNRSRTVDVERFFSTPPDRMPSIRVREQDAERIVTTPAADSFAGFLSAFADAVARRDFSSFMSALEEDARLVERLREAIGQS